MVFFPDFQYGFWCPCSTANLLTVVFDRIDGAFNKSWATRAAALDVSKAFNRFWHAGLLHKPKQVINSPLIFGGGWRILKWYIFWCLSFLKILGRGRLCLLGETWYISVHKLQHMILAFMQLSRSLDCYIMLYC